MCLGHVYIVLEPVGSARLTFDDDRYYEFMCFDVPKVVRSPGCDHGHDEESRNGRDIKIDILGVRTPTRCHIDLAGNTSYHFAASRTVSPRVSSYLFPGTVCAFWLTYMIVSLASI